MPLRRRTREQTLVSVAVANLRLAGKGWTESTRLAAGALTTAALLARAKHEGAGADGSWPTQVEYAKHFGISERTAQREWRVYKDAFGETEDPQRLAAFLLQEYSDRIASLPSLVMSLPAEIVGTRVTAQPGA